ncbi:hypothetical protein [Streptomyces tagetis]|uniref:Transcriptional regulator n=1 Tax=Streptomyces tagetis TaxID=2820809 RepID=A0A940XHM4_9ACTN|nr:hypothetical protein [Streptomyces sp. RG38]MBQ0827342.1 hypothetical protein [Streptomyces sp. RG38]
MAPNALLSARMRAAGHTQQSLADALNARIEEATGMPGTVSDRTVRNWLTGKSRTPRARQAAALRAEFGCAVENLGFAAPARTDHAPAPEDPVRRRTFAGSGAAALVSAALPAPSSASPRVGMTDAARLETAFTEVTRTDNELGGHISLETRALAFAEHAMELQNVGSAPPRVRARLYYLASAFTGTAAWSAIDANEPARAGRHLDRALHLAQLAGSSEMRLRLMGHASVLALQLHRPHDALAAAEAGRNTYACSRDPLYRSLAAARLAGIQAGSGQARAARHSFDTAITAFSQVDHMAPRPTWVGFYDTSELTGLGSLMMSRLGEHAEAESLLHRTLATLRPDYVRNRRYYTAHLAITQLRQGEPELAARTAASVLPSQAGDSLTGRTSQLMTDFTQGMASLAPSTRSTTDWLDRYTAYRQGS